MKERLEKANLVREHICLISPAVSAQNPRRFAAALLGEITGDEVGSRLFADLAKTGVTEEELTKAKNKVLSSLVIKNELPMGRLVDLGFNWTYLGQYRPIEEDVKAVKAVTVADINDLLKDYPLGDFTQFSLAPAKNS